MVPTLRYSDSFVPLPASLGEVGDEGLNWSRLIDTLQAANRRQGAGFVVFGAVVTKRTMWLAASALWGAVFTLGPLLAGDAAVAGMGSSGGQHGSAEWHEPLFLRDNQQTNAFRTANAQQRATMQASFD